MSQQQEQQQQPTQLQNVQIQNTGTSIISSSNVIVPILFTTCKWQTLDNNVTNHIKWFWVFNISISSLEVRNGINGASIHLLIHFKERLLLMRKPHRYTFKLRISTRLKQIEWNSVFFYSAIIFTFYHQPFTIRHCQPLKVIEQFKWNMNIIASSHLNVQGYQLKLMKWRLKNTLCVCVCVCIFWYFSRAFNYD